jgi:type I restriction enzyme, S subunit
MSDTQPLSELADINPGTSIPRDGLCSFVGMEDVSETFELVSRHDRSFNARSGGYTRFLDGDLLFAKITPCMENGKGALLDGLTEGRGFGSTEFYVLRPFRPESRQFLGQWLASRTLRKAAEAQMTGSAGQRRVPADFFFRFRIPKLSPGEQQRIGAILDALDDQLRSTERVISKLNRTGPGLLADLLRGRASDGRGHPHVDRGQLPPSWTVSHCQELCREITVGIVIRPSQYYRESGVPMLRSANVRASGLVLDELKYMSPSDHAKMRKTSVTPGDLVTVRTGYPGTTALIPKGLEEANCIDIIISRPGPRVLPEYLEIWINSEFGKGQVLRVQGGLAQQHFNVSEMKSLLVAVPPIAEQQRIVDIWAEHKARINTEIDLAESLRLLKMGLTSDLLSGRVRVPAEVAS